jgi:hypothetical protein
MARKSGAVAAWNRNSWEGDLIVSDLISLETVFIRRGDLVETEIDGEVVMMSLSRGNCYGLDNSAARIWKLLQSPTSAAALCGTLSREYDVEPENCRREVLTFLDQLRQENLIEIVG